MVDCISHYILIKIIIHTWAHMYLHMDCVMLCFVAVWYDNKLKHNISVHVLHVIDSAWDRCLLMELSAVFHVLSSRLLLFHATNIHMRCTIACFIITMHHCTTSLIVRPNFIKLDTIRSFKNCHTSKFMYLSLLSRCRLCIVMHDAASAHIFRTFINATTTSLHCHMFSYKKQLHFNLSIVFYLVFYGFEAPIVCIFLGTYWIFTSGFSQPQQLH